MTFCAYALASQLARVGYDAIQIVRMVRLAGFRIEVFEADEIAGKQAKAVRS